MATVKESVSAKGKNKGTSKALAKPKARPPQDERYDWSRTQGPNPEDVRTLGAPCFGEHIEAVPTRGSGSGANKWGKWTACEACGLRLSYTPTWGSPATSRAAGPLAPDVKKQIEEKKPEKGSMDLKDKKITLMLRNAPCRTSSRPFRTRRKTGWQCSTRRTARLVSP